MMKSRYYYNFTEVLDLAGFDSYTDYIEDQFDDPKFDRTIVTELLTRFNYRSQAGCYFEIDDIEYVAEPGRALFTPRLNLFTNVIYETYDEYANLIKLQQDNIDKVGDSIKQISISRFNDTPQNTGDFIDDIHTSTINKNEVYTELDLASKLDQARIALNDIYNAWLKVIKPWLIFE